jgi:hypothetical protein
MSQYLLVRNQEHDVIGVAANTDRLPAYVQVMLLKSIDSYNIADAVVIFKGPIPIDIGQTVFENVLLQNISVSVSFTLVDVY